MTKNNETAMLQKIRIAYVRSLEASNVRHEAREELADAIRDARDAGIRYRQITEIIGIGKTGLSSILARSKNGN